LKIRWIFPCFLVACGWFATTEALQSRRARQLAALAEPFVGVTIDGKPISGLYAIHSTGVSTEPVRQAAKRFLEGLSESHRNRTRFPIDSTEWRDWHNVHRAPREGVSFGDMNARQRELAVELFAASLSAKGLKKTKNVMKLNEHLAELVGKHDEYGEEFYFITVMGEPSATEPWGWQLDGHHLVINYFVLGDQVVMSPTFMGSEPVIGSGKYAGVTVMQDEQDKGLAFMEALDEGQRRRAILGEKKTRNNSLAAAFNDNLVLDYAGLKASELDASQKKLLLEVIEEYVGNLSDGHAKIRMSEVESHLDETYSAWIGDTGPDSVFYYRIQSPVILIEFDHQGPIALEGPKVPSRRHVHSVMRTPNGNDYGKDLLRQHYEAHRHNPSHGHRQ
jgi:hypothetical protein